MTDFQAILTKAHAAGAAAAAACAVRPMVVGEADGLSDRFKPGATLEYVADGVCGFAWVAFPGNTAWARWAKKNANARPSYPKGLQISISAYNQSMQRKEAHAQAFAKVLNEHGISCYANSRMD